MQNQYNKTKSVVEAGLFSALIVIIMLLNVYVPIFSAVGTFLLPIPVALLFIRYDYKITLSAIVVSALLVGILYNPLSALSAAVTYGLTGITLGYCIRKDKKSSTILLYLTIVSVASIIISGSIAIFFVNKTSVLGIIKQYTDLSKESMNMTKNIYGQVGLDTTQVDSLLKAWEIFTPEHIMTILPALLLLTGFISALINYMVSRAILKKMRYNLKELIPFEKVYLDNRIGALIVIIVCLGIILTQKNYAIGKPIFNSSVIVLQFAFLIDGLAVAIYYLKNKFNVSRIVLIFITIFALFSQLSQIFIYIGIGDMIFDFRKLDPNRMFRRNS